MVNADLLFISTEQLIMSTYYVSITGTDSIAHDGLSLQTAWRSLSYASDRVPAGNHTIQLGSGKFVATQTASPKSGVTIAGMGDRGEDSTHIVASPSWQLAETPNEKKSGLSEYLITFRGKQNITIRDLTLASEPEHRITGAFYAADSKNIVIRDVTVQDFRWAGLNFKRSSGLNIYNNHIENASTEKFRFHNGLIRTRFIKDSEIHHNTIVSTVGGGYGYKGGGHENVRIQHNSFNLDRGFAIESAHENEIGVEISHNVANQTISIPKGGQGENPNDSGYEYSFWIHHNLLTDSYAIEGPRNHLRLSHNYIRVEDTGGNIYTQHGGKNNGPVWIHNNVIENVDRGLVWVNRGDAKNIYVYNNTVTFANAGDRAGAILSAPNRNSRDNNNISGWVAHNNIFIAPASQPRKLFRESGADPNITAANNVMVNVTNAPADSFIDVAPDFLKEGDRPWPFYAPESSNSPLVDRGIDVGLPFTGTAPDIGAYELGHPAPFSASVSLLGSLLLAAVIPVGLLKLNRSSD